MTRSLLLRRSLLGMLAAALLAAACSPLAAASAYTMEVQLERSFNLFPGSPVRVLGVKVGVVSDIGVREGDDFVTATLRITDADRVIPIDGTAQIVTESLLGERFVQLEPFLPGDEPAPTSGHVITLVDEDGNPRTSVPSEFDEVLEGLNNFVGGLNPDDVQRFFHNLATVLEGNGERLGSTIEQARVAINVLQEHDEELVTLAARLADLNETLGTRDEEFGDILEDWNTVAETIVAERGDLDVALDGLARFSNALGELLNEHRPGLQADIETVTRIGRTAVRNLGHLERAAVYTSELFRHAERVVTRDPHYWLPLLNALGTLATGPLESTQGSLIRRIESNFVGGGTAAERRALADLIEPLCIPLLQNCQESATTAGDVLAQLHAFSPELFEEVLANNGLNDEGDQLLRDLIARSRS
ncbi:MAG: MCE family protein [Nitriliruptorales bacterium]|nr:MCE family protein [Nitriliruptorales bacterium]